MSNRPARIGIIGAGGVAFGTAAFCASRGHDVRLWSPSGARTKVLQAGTPLVCSGALEGVYHVGTADTLMALAAHADVLIFALPAYAHKPIISELAACIERRHTVIFSAHASLEALYFLKCLRPEGLRIPVAAWGTTIGTCRQLDLSSVAIGTIRSAIDACGLPGDLAGVALATCRSIFGDRFTEQSDLLAVTLSNFNPQHHMGIGLCNMTRMEKGEHWIQPAYVTPNTGRLMEALDRERLAVARAAGHELRDIYTFFAQSYQVPPATVSEMNGAIYEKGMGGPGPNSADNRYVNEDVPFGLVVTLALAALAGVAAPLHAAGVALFSAMYGRDLAAENNILDEIIDPGMTLDDLSTLCVRGYIEAGRISPGAART